MSLEQTVAGTIAAQLASLPALSGVRVVAASDDGEQEVPRVVVDVERHGVAIPGYAVWNLKVEVEIVANAFPQSNAASLSGNQNIEALFVQVEGALTGDVTAFSSPGACVYGAKYDGAVTDLREKNVIRRRWDMTLFASPQ
jgi:hypothetical protein